MDTLYVATFGAMLGQAVKGAPEFVSPEAARANHPRAQIFEAKPIEGRPGFVRLVRAVSNGRRD